MLSSEHFDFLITNLTLFLAQLFPLQGENSHLLLSVLVKHLDHKNVIKQRDMQINIVDVTAELAKNAKQQASVAIIGAISELVKHLRKCMLYSSEASIHKNGSDTWNEDLQVALEKCISQLSDKVCVSLNSGYPSEWNFFNA